MLGSSSCFRDRGNQYQKLQYREDSHHAEQITWTMGGWMGGAIAAAAFNQTGGSSRVFRSMLCAASPKSTRDFGDSDLTAMSLVPERIVQIW